MLKLAIDFDGVLSNTMELWCKKYNILYNKNISLRDIKKWDFYTDFSLNTKQAFEIFDLCWMNYDQLNPIELDCGKTLGRLGINNSLDVVTSMNEKHYESLKKWLILHGVVCNDVVFSQHKYELDYDYFIDDSPANAIEIEKRGKICLLYDQEWNKLVKEGERIIRVNSLKEAEKCIQRDQ